jgi:hypothetical protein
MKKNNLLNSILVFLAIWLCGFGVFAEENHQHSNECRNEPTADKVQYCNAMNNKDGTACNKIKSFELKSHCLIVVADFSRSNFHAYTPIAPTSASTPAKAEK